MKLTDDDKNIICDISKVELNPNDVIVLDFKNTNSTSESLYKISKSINDMFPNNKILFLCNGVELKIIDGGSENEQGD